ncbi:hypothetical protein [Nocardioides terrigena]|jgi:hypothetical protein|uniref:hypothetical protein n=1 Tax=Nocardioides terrigena TaxID=424797 RepID=UPI00131F0F42|nr:hypothetical protein [Nocardioides terrigena]
MTPAVELEGWPGHLTQHSASNVTPWTPLAPLHLSTALTTPDAQDRHACRLRLTWHGQRELATTRADRRGVVREVLQSWSPGGSGEIRVLLAAFNADLDNQLTPNPHEQGQSQP